MSEIEDNDFEELPIPRKATENAVRMHGQKRVEWEPNARQWAIYDAVRRGYSYRHVGFEFELSFQRVGEICRQIDRYLSQLYIDRVRELRERHTQHLEHIFCEAMAAWERSKKAAVEITSEEVELDAGADWDGSKVTLPAKKIRRKKSFQAGAPVFLNEARGALNDIRKIHAVDVNPKVREEEGDEDEGRVAGKDRDQLITERINALSASLKTSKAVGQQTTTEQAG